MGDDRQRRGCHVRLARADSRTPQCVLVDVEAFSVYFAIWYDRRKATSAFIFGQVQQDPADRNKILET